MTDPKIIEQGILRAVGKLFLIGLLVGAIIALGYAIVSSLGGPQ